MKFVIVLIRMIITKSRFDYFRTHNSKHYVPFIKYLWISKISLVSVGLKLIGYFSSDVNMVSSNPCVNPSTNIYISLFLLSICTDELILATKIITFFPTFSSVNEVLNQNQILIRNHYSCIYRD